MEEAAGAGGPRQTSGGVSWMPDRGKLYRFWGDGHPGVGGVTVIRPWPEPMAWAKDDDKKGFRHVTPSIDLMPFHPDEHRRRKTRWRAVFERPAWETVPATVREAVCAAHLDGHQWRALSFQARVPGARRLAEDVPLLAAMLACGGAFRVVARPLRSARALLRAGPGWKTWRRTARWLRLDDSKAMIRVLRKAGRSDTPSGAWSLQSVRWLTQAWREPSLRKVLLHLDRITPQAGELLATCAEHGVTELLTVPLLEQLMEQDDRARVGNQLWMLIDHAQRIQQPRLLRPVHSIEAFEGRLLEAILLSALEDGSDKPSSPRGPFPLPPLPAPRFGRPLASEDALRTEGKEMQHCIGWGTYAMLARGRHGYGYALQLPDGPRATAWIERDPHTPGSFRLQQLQGVKNTMPHPELDDIARRWLQLHAAWARHRAGEGPRPSGEAPPPPGAQWLAPPGPARTGFPYADDDIPF